MPGLLPVSPSEYRFDAPCLVVDDGLRCFSDSACWQSGEAWLRSIEDLANPPRAVVIPLELAAVGRTRQELLGYELLSALRWSGNDTVCGIPALIAAWQPLQDILRRRADMLIVQPAIQFCRLPEALDGLPAFVRKVSEGRIASSSRNEISALAGTVDQQASRLSYHDLANDYYAAYRILKGYLSLLRRAEKRGVPQASSELLQLSSTPYEWQRYVEDKLRSPLVRRFQATRAGLRAPRYPMVEESLDVLTYHLQEGLPHGTRVLLVDDEFHKGSAEVLLRILFRQSEFTRRTEGEWVYSESDKGAEDRWARFVCTRNADLARNWLTYWEGSTVEESAGQDSWRAWLSRWDRDLNPGAKRPKGFSDAEDVFAQGREFVLDSHAAGPRIKSTVVLLDLRLEPVQGALYSIRDFSSYRLRRSIKAERPDMPVIMFTASRQVLNFAELLDSSTEIDGWFVKEGPDTPVDDDDANSANSVAYLLERLHLYSTLRGWYRTSFAWDTERKLAYARLFHSPRASQILDEVASLSTRLFEQILDQEKTRVSDDAVTFLGFVQERVPATPFPVCQTLVARRLVLAALLWTADLTPAGPIWNVDAFVRLLPGRASKKSVKWVYDKLNFNQVLWMRSSDVLSQLLREEIDWLDGIPWPDEKRASTLSALERERRLATSQ